MAKKILVSSVTALLLTGCFSPKNVQGDWQCPIDQGQGCQTISVADGENMGKTKPARAINLAGQVSGNVTDERTDEYIGTIHFYPFIDGDGNYHAAHKIKKVFIPSDWARK